MSSFRSSLLAAGAALALLAGCASSPLSLSSPSAGLFDDASFAPPAEPIDPQDAFRMTPDMQAYLDDTIMPLAKKLGIRQAISEALYDRRQLQLEYDATTTRTAAEAFRARQGNCLSLVIMTGAFAKAANLDVNYQEVGTDETWSRSAGMYFFSGHVNLSLERHAVDRLRTVDRTDLYTIDFMPNDGSEVLRPLSESTVLAMFMNNRAAEALVRGQLDDAYWRARRAIELDRKFISAYNTLGVVYLRHGDNARAEQVLRVGLAAQANNPRLLGNYALALEGLGRTAEAEAVKTRLAAVEPIPPFYWFVQGQVAMHKGEYQKARELFLKEIKRSPDYHEFHYALAVADFELDRIDEARREMALAMDSSVKRSDHDLYSGKLDKLRAWQASANRSQTLAQ